MVRIYFDNAATTMLDREVLNTMMPFLTDHFGNPSSTYSYGRESRMAVEAARKKVAGLLGAEPQEIYFTSGGTESINTALTTAVHDLRCRHIITSRTEHHATLHCIEHLRRNGDLWVSHVRMLPDGHIDMMDLERLLAMSKQQTLVSLMHANNETGNLADMAVTGYLAKKYGALFLADTVQTVGHYPFDLKNVAVDFITGAGHKFHGPKGIGMLYIRNGLETGPLIHGGGQEKNLRAGTENVAGIAGFAKALELAMENYERDHSYISNLKLYLRSEMVKAIPGTTFNGDPEGNSLYTVLSMNLPKNEQTENLLFQLDLAGICVSGGSACSGGAASHVIKFLNANHTSEVTIRFSFSKYNTAEEVDKVVDTIRTLVA